MQRVMVIPYRRFGDKLSVPPSWVKDPNIFLVLSFEFFSPEKTGPIGCPETSVRNDHYSLRNDSEERSSHPLRGRSLQSRATEFIYKQIYIYIYFHLTLYSFSPQTHLNQRGHYKLPPERPSSVRTLKVLIELNKSLHLACVLNPLKNNFSPKVSKRWLQTLKQEIHTRHSCLCGCP